MALERRLPSPLVVKVGWTACPVKAGLWPPPPAADGLDRARRPAVVCHHEIDGKLWPSQQFQTAGFRPFSDRCRHKEWTVFYLNRIFCAHFDLVYQTGGWQRVSVRRL